jgi:DNA polymerase IV
MNDAKPAVQWLFLDLNAFFASCEQQEAPALRGKPVNEAYVSPMRTLSTALVLGECTARARLRRPGAGSHCAGD